MKEDSLKSENINDALSSQTPSLFGRNLFSKINIVCSQNHPGNSYCIDCQKIAITCARKQCQCLKVHQKCQSFIRIDHLHQNLNERLFNKNNIQEVTQITDLITDEVSDLEDRIQKQFEYFGLNSAEESIVRIIQKINQGHQITGKQFQTYKNQKQKYNQENWLKESVNKFYSLIQKSRKIVDGLFDELEATIAEEHVKFMRKFDFSKLKSDIIKNSQQQKKLERMLSENHVVLQLNKIYPDEKIKNMKMNGVIEACDQKTNLLFLVENSVQKKFGAFSNCKLTKWDTAWQVDQTGSSFVFSLDLDSKQELDKKNQTFKITNELGKQSINFGVTVPERLKDSGNFTINSVRYGMKIAMHENTFIDIPNSDFIKLNGQTDKKQINLKILEVYQVIARKQNKKETVETNSFQPQNQSMFSISNKETQMQSDIKQKNKHQQSSNGSKNHEVQNKKKEQLFIISDNPNQNKSSGLFGYQENMNSPIIPQNNLNSPNTNLFGNRNVRNSLFRQQQSSSTNIFDGLFGKNVNASQLKVNPPSSPPGSIFGAAPNKPIGLQQIAKRDQENNGSNRLFLNSGRNLF